MRTCSAISLNENYVHTLDRTYPCKMNATDLYKMSAININSFTVLWKPLSPSWISTYQAPPLICLYQAMSTSTVSVRQARQWLYNMSAPCWWHPSLCLQLLADTAKASLLYKQAEPCITPLSVWCSPAPPALREVWYPQLKGGKLGPRVITDLQEAWGKAGG